MRKVNLIVLHCSDSDITAHDNVDTIRKWHVEERGWSDIGYHFVITQDGQVYPGRELHRKGAHVKGLNDESIGICLTGREHFSDMQFASLYELCDRLLGQYGLHWTDVLLHNELDKSKTCPNFKFKDIFLRS